MNRSVDWLLLVFVLLVLALLGLGIVFFFRPAADGVLVPRWWHGVALATLLFSALGVATFRHRKRRRGIYRDVLTDPYDARDPIDPP